MISDAELNQLEKDASRWDLRYGEIIGLIESVREAKELMRAAVAAPDGLTLATVVERMQRALREAK